MAVSNDAGLNFPISSMDMRRTSFTPRSLQTFTAPLELSMPVTSNPFSCRYSENLPAPQPISRTRPFTRLIACCSRFDQLEYSEKYRRRIFPSLSPRALLSFSVFLLLAVAFEFSPCLRARCLFWLRLCRAAQICGDGFYPRSSAKIRGKEFPTSPAPSVPPELASAQASQISCRPPARSVAARLSES